MTVDTPRYYLAAEANDTLRQKLMALQTELFRQFGLIEARLLPPLFFLYHLAGIDAGAAPARETGKTLLSFAKAVLPPSILTISPPAFQGDELFLAIKPLPDREAQVMINSIRLERLEQAARGFLILAKPGKLPLETAVAIEEKGRHFFPVEERLGKLSFVLIRIDELQATKSSWEIYPLQ